MGSYTGQRRQTSSVCGWIKFALLGVIVSFCFEGALCEVEPTESQCRPYIEKALKEQHLEVGEQTAEVLTKEFINDQEGSPPTDELTDSTEGSITNEEEGKESDDHEDDDEAEIKTENDDDGEGTDEGKTEENDDTNDQDDEKMEEQEEGDGHDDEEDKDGEEGTEGLEIVSKEEDEDTKEDEEEKESDAATASKDDDDEEDKDAIFEKPIDIEIQEVEMDNDDDDSGKDEEQTDDTEDKTEEEEKEDDKDKLDVDEKEDEKDKPDEEEADEEKDKPDEEEADEEKDKPDEEEAEDEKDKLDEEEKDDEKDIPHEDEKDKASDGDKDEEEDEKDKDEKVDNDDMDVVTKVDDDEADTREEKDEETEQEKVKEDEDDSLKEPATEEEDDTKEAESGDKEDAEAGDESEDKKDDGEDETVEEKIEKARASKPEGAVESEDEEGDDQERPEEEELIKEMVIPENLRPRDHIDKILKLEESGVETILERTIDTTLKGLKGLYDNAIKPLEMLYKYRDLSNRHFGDPEIFSKPLVLFMGPWSGGKSSTINYLLDNEFSHTSLRTGAEPSPAYFNILMYGEEEEILDGTQLAADWTFSGLQKFGQGLLDRLRGVKLPNKLLEKVNIVEIPGILEIRKQVQRLFPFNDACQWFIDRADIIFLVYDPSKLDVGPETEAILDQLKGREYQTRIILNKADQVKPEELMRVQGTLIWNISPLMSSSEPPIMYSTSLWSLPYEVGAPTRLLQAQERAFLRDLREAIDKRVENKISSARRFAVRVRNHAKMVDCYLTTYYNHKTIFGNRKKISDDIIEYPQKYHIYEGLSTLTNISRYDLPDPDVYRDFFKINPLYEFKKLSETCTYFRGCPINQLDVAIAYDLPELVGKYKKAVETAKEQLQKENS